MNIEKITPQIAALYMGRMCDLQWLYTDTIGDAFEKGDIWYDSEIIGAHISRIERDELSITPHLRRLESIIEEEANEIYEICHGAKFPQKGNALTWWNNPLTLDYANREPAILLKLLEWGFDLFGLIDAHLAKEVNR